MSEDFVREGGAVHAAFINALRDVVREHAQHLESGALMAMLNQIAGEVAYAHNRAAKDVGEPPVPVTDPRFVAGVVTNMMLGYDRGERWLEVTPSGSGQGRTH